MRCKIRERLDEERESWFEVDTICGENHVVLVRDGGWERVAPGMKRYEGRRE